MPRPRPGRPRGWTPRVRPWRCPASGSARPATPRAFSLLTASPAARAHYDRRRDRNDTHAAACRNLANRYFGMLHHCLQRHQPYNETVAFGHLPAAAA